MNILEHVSESTISRIELCNHWEPWDDCYLCGTEDENDIVAPYLLADILIYLVSPTAQRGTAPERESHAEQQ